MLIHIWKFYFLNILNPVWMQSFLLKKKALTFTKVIQEKAEKSKFFKQSRYSDIKNKFMLKKTE